MSAHWKEIVGFLCRWCLLVLALAVVVGAAALTLAAISAVPAEVSTRVLLRDSFQYPPRLDSPAYMLCEVQPNSSVPHAVVWHRGDGVTRQAEGAGGQIWLRCWNPPSRGEEEIHVQGNPFSSLALQETWGTLQMAPVKRNVYLVDARLVRRRLDKEPLLQECKSLLAELRRHGDVAMVFPGGYAQMAAIRTTLRTKGFTEAVFCEIQPKSATDILNHARGVEKKQMIMVTDDESFAAAATKEGFSVFHVGSSSASAATKARQFPSLTKFKDWLARQPISK